MNRMVLFVVYDFPPEGARGTKRSLKFIRYLPGTRWEPVVLTVENSANRSFHDSSLLEELPPKLPVFRARTLENIFHGKTPSGAGTPASNGHPAKGTGSEVIRRAVLRLYHGLGKFAGIPDSRVLWLPFAVSEGLRVIRDMDCRVIYSSGPSHTNHVVGAILSHLTRIPLVIDFRDAWVGNPAVQFKNAWVQSANALLERFCVAAAKVVVCTTGGIEDDFENRYRGSRTKCVTITNGFDPSDFPAKNSQESCSPSSILKIVHAGTLGGERSPKEFLRALGQLLSEHPALRSKLRVTFVGRNRPFADGRTMEDYLSEYQCGSVVELTGFVSRKESLEFVRDAHVLLLIIGRVPREGAFVYGISGKIYDYAAAQKPVLTVAEPGSTAEIAKRLNLGPIVHPDHIDEIKSALLSFVEAYGSNGIPYDPDVDVLKTFEFSALTRRLSECFDKVCADKNGHPASSEQQNFDSVQAVPKN